MSKLGNWMWLPDKSGQPNAEPEFVYFRGSLELFQLPQRFTVQITADSRYKLYVNGEFVEMGPSRGNKQVWYVDTVDIAPHLKTGSNTLAVIVLRYPYAHWKGNCGIFRTETPGLYVQTEEPIRWKCRRAENINIVSENPYFAPLMIYENSVGDKLFAGWMDGGYDDSLWYDPQYYEDVQLSEVLRPDKLVPRTIPFLYRRKRKFIDTCGKITTDDWNGFLAGEKHIRISPYSHVTVDINAGVLMTGYLRLALTGGTGAKVTLLQSECYAGEIVENPDPYKCLPRKGDRSDDSMNLYGYADTYRVNGFGNESKPEIYEPFWFRTFRYIRLTVQTHEEPLELVSFDYEETGYPLEVITAVKTSNPTMAGIWDISERSLRRCMHETYEDCPFYEQLQYAMDTRSQILYTYAVSADPRLAIKAMDDFSRAARPDGMINCSFPNFETNVIPSFGVYYIGMVYDYMMYFGNRDQIEKYMPTIDGILRFFQNHLDQYGLVDKVGDVNGSGGYWSFIDWTPGWDDTTGVPPCTKQGPITMESLLYILGLQYAADIADYLGHPQRADACHKQAAVVQSAVNRHCIGKNGLYQDGPGIESYSQHTQVFAVLTDTASIETGQVLLEETTLHPEQYEQCSVAMMFYLFRALEKCDLYHYTEKLWDIWRDMVSNNLTTCAEDSLMARSDCHAWGALALYEIPSVILGVRPGKPGYEEIVVAPHTQTMEWAQGTVVTPKGEVRVFWSKESDGKAKLHVEGPKEIPITVRNE